MGWTISAEAKYRRFGMSCQLRFVPILPLERSICVSLVLLEPVRRADFRLNVYASCGSEVYM